MGSKVTSIPYPFEKDATQINHYGEGVIAELNHSETHYIVRGVVINAKTNTKLPISKCFTNIAGADKYFIDIIEEFPISEIILEKEVVTEIKLYV